MILNSPRCNLLLILKTKKWSSTIYYNEKKNNHSDLVIMSKNLSSFEIQRLVIDSFYELNYQSFKLQRKA